MQAIALGTGNISALAQATFLFLPVQLAQAAERAEARNQAIGQGRATAGQKLEALGDRARQAESLDNDVLSGL
jgi:hypothetical protein